MVYEKECFELLKLLESLRSEEFVYIVNTGNAGDSAIYFATVKLFESLSLTYKTFTKFTDECKGKTVLIGGGGAMASEQSDLSKTLAKAINLSKNVIILPHTLKNLDRIFESSQGNLTIFCREKKTYDYLENFNNIERYLVHDIVFSLDTLKYKQLSSTFDKIKVSVMFIYFYMLNSPLKFRLKDLLKVYNSGRIVNRIISKSNSNILNAFRVDEEKTNIEIPKINSDISSIFQLSNNNPLLAEVATRMMIHTLSKFEEINTNRLHVAILSSLLGKKVNFYDNSYFKCREVYLHSLQKKFPKVSFNPK